MTSYNDEASRYITALFAREDEALRRIREESPQRGLPTINIQPEEAHFLHLLVLACGARRAVEFGTLGGYSGSWIARALPAGGRLITVEKNPEHAAVARDHFALAGVADRVEVRVGDGHQLLPELATEAPFDLVFIDADKAGYIDYFEWAVLHSRSGGIIVAHNALWQGRLVDPSADDEETQLIRAFNQHVAQDERVASTIYPAGDGMVVAVKLT